LRHFLGKQPRLKRWFKLSAKPVKQFKTGSFLEISNQPAYRWL
jgi:hypothetical protein